MLLQTTLLLNVHAQDGGGNEVTDGDESQDRVHDAQVVDLGVLAGRAEGEAGAPEREAAAASSERLFR